VVVKCGGMKQKSDEDEGGGKRERWWRRGEERRVGAGRAAASPNWHCGSASEERPGVGELSQVHAMPDGLQLAVKKCTQLIPYQFKHRV
jgi:hypothetical protein